MIVLASTSSAGPVWEYLLLFLAVMASWAGVPGIGAAALGAAGVAASQGNLNLAAVVIVATVAGEVGGLIGYAIGVHWGRELVTRPGKHQASRERMLGRGERAYATWGRLAVFFTPAIISGTAKMKLGQFAIWNFIAAFAFSVSVAATAYGLGRVATGHHSPFDVATLVVGVIVATLVIWTVHRHRRGKASRPLA